MAGKHYGSAAYVDALTHPAPYPGSKENRAWAEGWCGAKVMPPEVNLQNAYMDACFAAGATSEAGSRPGRIYPISDRQTLELTSTSNWTLNANASIDTNAQKVTFTSGGLGSASTTVAITLSGNLASGDVLRFVFGAPASNGSGALFTLAAAGSSAAVINDGATYVEVSAAGGSATFGIVLSGGLAATDVLYGPIAVIVNP